MRKWYRLLVVFMAISAVCMTSLIAYAGFELRQTGKTLPPIVQGDRLWWSNGLYEAEGTLSDGVLQEMTIRRLKPNEQE